MLRKCLFQITFYALSEQAIGRGLGRSSSFLLLLYVAAIASAEVTVVDSAFATVVTATYSSFALRYGIKISHAVTAIYIILNRMRIPSSLISRLV